MLRKVIFSLVMFSKVFTSWTSSSRAVINVDTKKEFSNFFSSNIRSYSSDILEEESNWAINNINDSSIFKLDSNCIIFAVDIKILDKSITYFQLRKSAIESLKDNDLIKRSPILVESKVKDFKPVLNAYAQYNNWHYMHACKCAYSNNSWLLVFPELYLPEQLKSGAAGAVRCSAGL